MSRTSETFAGKSASRKGRFRTRRRTRRPCLSSEYRAFRQALGQSLAPGWVAVQDHLPEAEGFVLVFVAISGQACVASTFWDGKAFWENDWAWTPNDISHWMALPPPPDVRRQRGFLQEETEPQPVTPVAESGNAGAASKAAAAVNRQPLFRRMGLLRWVLIPMIWVLTAVAYPSPTRESRTTSLASHLKQQIRLWVRGDTPEGARRSHNSFVPRPVGLHDKEQQRTGGVEKPALTRGSQLSENGAGIRTPRSKSIRND